MVIANHLLLGIALGVTQRTSLRAAPASAGPVNGQPSAWLDAGYLRSQLISTLLAWWWQMIIVRTEKGTKLGPSPSCRRANRGWNGSPGAGSRKCANGCKPDVSFKNAVREVLTANAELLILSRK